MVNIVEQIPHTPVMLDEVLGYLNPEPSDVIVDATIGTGGHSQAILERIGSSGKLIGIDRDEESLAICRQRLHKLAGNMELVHGNFSDIDIILGKLGMDKVDGIIFDLGISSFQLSNPERGFSFQNEGPLDMRMDKESYISAYDLLNNLNEDEISNILWTFGQERWHNRIARMVVHEREKSPISTTSQLANIVCRSIPARYRHRYYRIHPATRTFQAVRIAVNRELEILESSILKAISLLKPRARICVISFHSLEDRAIKFTFRNASKEGLVEIVTLKPLTPKYSEVQKNSSSRSSKLRVAEKI